jgi:hypothetical protein
MHIPDSFTVSIKENSCRAKIASIKMGTSFGLAMVWGSTILLFNVSKQDFLLDKRWVCHELRHVLQCRQLGTFRFLCLYVWLSALHGYQNHPMEIDARLHETDFELLHKVVWKE